MYPSLRDIKLAALFVLLSVVVGVVSNLFRSEPLPWRHVTKQTRIAQAREALEKIGQRRTITTAELKALLKEKAEILLVDARPDMFFKSEQFPALPGAVNLPDDEFEKEYPQLVEKIKQAKIVIVYCQDERCDRADKVMEALRKRGHANVVHYTGGWREWENAK